MKKASKAKVQKIGGIVAWIVETFKPDFHLAKNPPKGNKRKVAVKREKGIEGGYKKVEE